MSTQAGVEAGTPAVTPAVAPAVTHDMTGPDAARDAPGDTVGDAVQRVRAGLVSGRGWTGIDVTALGRAELLSTHRDLARMRRELDGMLAYSSAEIARRSTPEDGQSGLAKREGFRSPEELVASISGGSTGDAHKLIEVGDAMSREENAAREENATRDEARDEAGSNSGADGGYGAGDDAEGKGAGTDGSGNGPNAAVVPLSPRFACVRDAVRGGKLSIDGANLITRMLIRIWDRHKALGLELSDIDRVERMLVERAHGLSANRFARIVRQLEAQMDSGRHALTEELQRQERFVTMFEDQAGMFVLRARLDAETAAPVRAAIDALVGNALYNRREKDQVVPDDRTVPQIRADALAALAAHCLGCDSDDLPLAATTVLVRLSLADLQSGDGVADIDGGSQPICISTARRMAANGEIIPIVLGGNSEILDLGRGIRIFNRPQRIALIERDGGCAFCGAPPGYTQAHHIRWWSRDCGPTDLNNGLLLCSTCHHRIHRDDWQIDIRNNQVWFTPPSAIDRKRVPRLGGRARFNAPKYQAA